MNFVSSVLSKLSSGSSGGSGVLGIDVGASAIKVVELQERAGVVTLTNYGELQLAPYADHSIGEAVTLGAKKEQEALAELLTVSVMQGKRGVIAMPLASSFVTNVSIEAKPEIDLSAMVRIEARKVIPASLSEVTLDWAEVEVSGVEAQAAKANQRNVLIAAIQNAALERFKVLAQFVGLAQPPSEIECFSIIRTVYDSEESDVAIIDIGATSAKLYISRKGQLMRMHRIRAGGVIATKVIADTLNISIAAAEELKCAADKQQETYVEMRRVHHASYDRAFREFNQVLRDYEQKTGIKIQTIYLSGGGALFPGIDAHLHEALNRKITLVNPFAKVAYPAFMEDTLTAIGPHFAVSVGAALRLFE